MSSPASACAAEPAQSSTAAKHAPYAAVRSFRICAHCSTDVPHGSLGTVIIFPMRPHVALAALALAVALPASAATLPSSVVARAGILPTSPFSFLDRAADAIRIAFALTPAAKTQVALDVAQERAAEAA